MENQSQNTFLTATIAPVLPQDSKAKFQQIVNMIKQSDWKQHLNSSIKSYSLQSYRLEEISITQLQDYYQKIFEKHQKNIQKRNHWFQNQLRIFLWLAATSPSIFNIPPELYGQEQLQKLIAPFHLINHDYCQYQFKITFFPPNNQNWNSQEDKLLMSIMKKSTQVVMWSIVAKEIFVESKNFFLRTSQSCRQRWQNHLDKNKVKGSWTDQEDYIIIKNINKFGKKWALINKKLGSSRTQHMVKNRFSTILKRQARKRSIRGAEEPQICKQIQKKLLDRTLMKQIKDAEFMNLQNQQVNTQDFESNIDPNLQKLNTQKNQAEQQVSFCLDFFTQKPSAQHTIDENYRQSEDSISRFLTMGNSRVCFKPYSYPLFASEILEQSQK